MPLPRQTVALLQAARQLVDSLPADAMLLLTETDLDWAAVRQVIGPTALLVAAEDPQLAAQFKKNPDLDVIDVDSGTASKQERLSLALLEAVRRERLRHGADV